MPSLSVVSIHFPARSKVNFVIDDDLVKEDDQLDYVSFSERQPSLRALTRTC